MAAYARKRVEIWIEAPLLKRVSDTLHQAGVSVYAVFDGREGRGISGAWNDAGLTDAHDMRLIAAIMEADVAETVCAALAAIFKRYPGVVLLSDVEVLRPERF